MTKAGLYCRISRDPEDKQEGVDRQFEDCKNIASLRGWTWAEANVYIDNDVSAYDFKKPRPSFSQLMQDFQSGLIEAVVVYDIDRMYRRVREAQLLLNQVDDFGLRTFVVASDTGDYDLAKPDEADQFRDNVKSAEKYSRQISKKVARKNLSRAMSGQPRKTRIRPYGYEWVSASDRWTLTLVEKEATLIREAVNRLLQGDSLAGICDNWNSRTPPPRTSLGNHWNPGSLRALVLSPRVAGLVQYYPREEQVRRWKESKHNKTRIKVGARELVLKDSDGQPVKGEWERVIDESTWERLVDRLEDPSRRKVFSQGERLYLLTGGIATCGACEGDLTSHKSKGQRAYRCSNRVKTTKDKGGCRVVQIADPLEEFVKESVVTALSGKTLDKLLKLAAKGDAHEKRLIDKRRELVSDQQRLVDLLADGVIDRAEYIPRRHKKDAEIAEIDQQLQGNGTAKLVTEIPSTEQALRKAWDERGVNWRRSLVALVLERVVVKPKRKSEPVFDMDRVSIVWRV